jgi:hypothetical protein
MYHKPPLEKSADMSDDEPDDIDIEKLLKDVELFGNYLILRCRALFKLSMSIWVSFLLLDPLI